MADFRLTSGEEFFTRVNAGIAFGGAQRLNPRSPRIENSPRRQPQPNEIVAVLAGQNQVMLAAIEAPAQKGSPVIDCASRRSEIDTCTVRGGGEQKNGIPGPVGGDTKLVRFDVVSLFGMQKEPLATPAAFRAATAGYFSVFAGGQTPF